MNSYSRSDLKLRGVILSEGTELKPQRGFCRNLRPSSRRFKQRINLSNRSYIIGRAYDEPLCGEHVENLLLQRNFIID